MIRLVLDVGLGPDEELLTSNHLESTRGVRN